MKTLYDYAKKYDGMKEVPGEASNAELLAIIKHYVPATFDDSKTAWCSILMMEALHEAYDITGANPAARSWLKAGEKTTAPVPYDTIVVIARGRMAGWQGHVGIYCGKSSIAGRIKIFAGNQGDKCCIMDFPVSKVLGYRRLKPKAISKVTDATIV